MGAHDPTWYSQTQGEIFHTDGVVTRKRYYNDACGWSLSYCSFGCGTYCLSSVVYDCYVAINSNRKRGCTYFLLCRILLFLKLALAFEDIKKGWFYELIHPDIKRMIYSQILQLSINSNAHFPPRSKLKLPFLLLSGLSSHDIQPV